MSETRKDEEIREALVNLLHGADMPFTAEALAQALGVEFLFALRNVSYKRIVDALLARVAPQGDEYGAGKWRALEEMAQAVKQGDADENAVIAWVWDTLGVRLAATPPAAETGTADTFRQWFRKYGEHTDDCLNYRQSRGQCDCGFAEAWRTIFPNDAHPARGTP